MLEIKSRHLTWGGPRWRATECQSYMVSITKARECASIFHLAKDVVIQKNRQLSNWPPKIDGV